MTHLLSMCLNIISAAGWSSLEARRAHNPKVKGSNPFPATKKARYHEVPGFLFPVLRLFASRIWSVSSDRISWHVAPQTLRHEVQAALHVVGLGNICDSESISGGFSPGVVECLSLAGGQRVFFKGSSTELNPVTPSLHLGEARLLQRLPATVPCARWIATVETGPWGGLVTEFLDGGNPMLPVTLNSVLNMIGIVDQLAELEPIDLPDILHPLESLLNGGYWMGARQFLEADALARFAASPLASVFDAASVAWLTSNLHGVATLETGFGLAVQGRALLHRDLRSDNVIATPAQGFVPVDWAWACIGNPVFELVSMLASLHLDGGPVPWEAIGLSQVGRTTAPEQVRTIVAGVLGYFLWASIQPPPPGIAHVRSFQARMALVCVQWMRSFEQSKNFRITGSASNS